MSRGSAFSKRTPKYTPLLCASRLNHEFNKCMAKAFEWTGSIVGTHPWKMFIFFCALLLLSAGGIYRVHLSPKLQYGFIDKNSRAIKEQIIRDEFHGQHEDHIQMLIVFVRRIDGRSMLNEEDLDAVAKIDRFISSTFAVFHQGKEFMYKNWCKDRCNANQFFYGFKQAFESLKMSNDSVIDWPKSKYSYVDILVAHHLHGVRWKTQQYNAISDSPILQSENVKLESVELVNLFYEAPLETAEALAVATEWETALLNWAVSQSDFPQYTIEVMGDKVLGQEMQRGGLSLLSHMLYGFLFTLLFVSLNVIFTLETGVRNLTPALLVIFGTIAAPISALVFTFGVLGWLEVEIYPIHIVLPFVVIAIGVDDSFLALNSWKHSLLSLNKAQHTTEIDAALSQVLVDVGPSMLLTSLTNGLAFVIGSFISPPAIQSFSIAASISMMSCFVFEIQCFCSLLAISGRFYKPGSVASSRPSKRFSKLLYAYSELITKRPLQICVLCVTAAFFVFSLAGALTMSTQINSTEIIPSDSPLRSTDRLLQRYVWKDFEPAQVYVNRPPNISDPHDFARFKQMVADFEALPRNIGSNATMLFTRVFEEVLKIASEHFHEELPLDYTHLPFFFEKISAWNSTVKWHQTADSENIVDALYFVIGFHNATSWFERAENMLNWRKVADRWPEFNITVYSENAAVYDGIFTMKSTTYTSALFTLIAMVFVCICFVPSVFAVVAAASAICNISLGVFGALSWLQFNLDPITMISIIMSIGFSVDYTAHICYHYYKVHQTLPSRSLPADYVNSALSSVGLPMIQAALSTIGCFLPVIFHPDYTPKVFVVSIFVVVVVGFLHGFVVLPAILSLLPTEWFISGYESRRQTVGVEPEDCRDPECPSPNTTMQPLLSLGADSPLKPPSDPIL